MEQQIPGRLRPDDECVDGIRRGFLVEKSGEQVGVSSDKVNPSGSGDNFHISILCAGRNQPSVIIHRGNVGVASGTARKAVVRQ